MNGGQRVQRSGTRIAIVVLTGLLLAPGIARADDPIFVGWTDLLPGLTAGYDPSSENDCKKGHENCVHAVIREMTQRFDGLAADCDHDAVFSLTYLRTTEEYHRFWHEVPSHFNEPNWLNHYDVIFGNYYFKAFDDWHKGNRAAVPEAWAIAFDAADKRQVSGSGNLFLGMSAHINRDLPYVLASIGMVAPDGTSRKEDHNTVNQFLNRIADALFPELAARFDPTVDDGEITETTLDNFASFQVVPAWREQAWRNAERLVAAQTSLERALVEAEIEANAAQLGRQFRDQYSYNALSSFDAGDRDAYCAAAQLN